MNILIASIQCGNQRCDGVCCLFGFGFYTSRSTEVLVFGKRRRTATKRIKQSQAQSECPRLMELHSEEFPVECPPPFGRWLRAVRGHKCESPRRLDGQSVDWSQHPSSVFHYDIGVFNHFQYDGSVIQYSHSYHLPSRPR